MMIGVEDDSYMHICYFSHGFSLRSLVSCKVILFRTLSHISFFQLALALSNIDHTNSRLLSSVSLVNQTPIPQHWMYCDHQHAGLETLDTIPWHSGMPTSHLF